MKFSIRDLLLVTVIVALAVGWWVDRSRLASNEEYWRREAADLAVELQNAGKSMVVTFPDGKRRRIPMP
jgi:hypothetical protein